MAAGRFVVAALAVVGAAAGGLTGIGASTAAAAPVNCATGGSASQQSTGSDTGGNPAGAQDGGARRASSSLSSTLDRAEADESSGRQANSGAADGTSGSSDGSGTLASRARAGGDAAARPDDRGTTLGSASELAQALAEALAGSTDPAARRIAAALADEGFVATGRGADNRAENRVIESIASVLERAATSGRTSTASGRGDDLQG